MNAPAAPRKDPHRNASRWFQSDARFYQLYPDPMIPLLARHHWSPLSVARMTSEFLVPHEGVRVLDIGSGAGTFCLTGAHFNPAACFIGVEQRKDLADHAEQARTFLGLDNACFIHRNFTQLDLRDYDHFYFYNSFYENIVGTDKIDDSIVYSFELYNYYTRYLYKELESMPTGTRIATFHSLGHEIPPAYHLVETKFENLLKFWMKL